MVQHFNGAFVLITASILIYIHTVPLSKKLAYNGRSFYYVWV